jgi:arylsulfatase A-like enzyme
LDKPDNDMGDGQMVQWAEKFLADPPKQPFFLAAGIYRPHLPWYTPRKYFEMYPPDGITPPLIQDDDLDDVPEAGRRIAEQRRGDLELVRRSGQYQRILQAYLASVTFCDVMVGRLLDALDASPGAKNTIIVFWSDNGWHFGEKQHLHKMTLWARSTRLPLIIVAPGVTRPETRSSRPASFIDLFPTLNELCGLPQPTGLEGTSLVPLLKNPGRTWERPALVTYLKGNHAVCSERWRYIRYTDGGEELYDQENDPHEWTNLADQPEFKAVKGKLAEWLPTTDAPAKTKRRKGKKKE